MKLGFRDIDAFVNRPNPAARVCLVYGPDQGLVRERAKKIAQSAVPDLSDPFNVVTLTAAQLIDDPARLADEAFAQSLMGGNRLLIVKDASDSLSPLFKDYLKAPSQHCLIVLEAGELGTKSALRALAEKEAAAAAIPCYVEDERDLSRLIEDNVRQAQLGIDRDALTLLASTLVGDRSVARSEIEKLLLYKHGDPDKVIRIADIMACSGDVRTQTMDELVYAVGAGDATKLTACMFALTQDNTSMVAVLRSVQAHFRKLYKVHMALQSGKTLETAMKALHPPIFFKFTQSFAQQIQRWTPANIEAALHTLNMCEADTKKTGASATLLTSHTLLMLTLMPTTQRVAA